MGYKTGKRFNVKYKQCNKSQCKLLRVVFLTISYWLLVIWNLLLLSMTRRNFASSINRRQLASFLMWKSVQQYLVVYIILCLERALEHFTNYELSRAFATGLGQSTARCVFSSNTRQAENSNLVFRFLLAPSKHCLGRTGWPREI